MDRTACSCDRRSRHSSSNGSPPNLYVRYTVFQKRYPFTWLNITECIYTYSTQTAVYHAYHAEFIFKSTNQNAILAWYCICSACMIVTLVLPDPHPSLPHHR